MNKKLAKRPGSVITFYSYKGGVGRSMALANVAVLLAQWGYKTLIIDWDLEAPGLENFFKDFIQVEKVKKQPGLIDILYSEAKGLDKKVSWGECVIPITIDSKTQKVRITDKLDLITSGSYNDDYYDKVRNFDFKDFYAANNGGYVIENIRREWKEAYDFILIDSRTGVTDIGGICTIHLPDLLVLLFTPTEQGFNGVVKVAKQAAAERKVLPLERWPELLTLPIPTRMDSSETLLHNQWLETFEDGLQDIYSVWLPDHVDRKSFLLRTKIPYISYDSFGENLPVIREGLKDTARMGYAYEGVAALLATRLDKANAIINNRDALIELAVNPTIDTEYLESKERAKVVEENLQEREYLVSSKEAEVNNKTQQIEKNIRRSQLQLYLSISITILSLIIAFAAWLYFGKPKQGGKTSSFPNNDTTKQDTGKTKSFDPGKSETQKQPKISTQTIFDNINYTSVFEQMVKQNNQFGIDISSKNPVQNWANIQTSGISFIIIKATQGDKFNDTTFAANWNNSKKYHIIRGAYHYFNNQSSGVSQALHFIKSVDLKPGDLPPILDLDILSKSTKLNPGLLAEVLYNIKTILQLFEKQYNCKPIIYATYGFAKVLADSKQFSDYPLWIGVYSGNDGKPLINPKLPAGWKNWTFWQFTFNGIINGIKNNKYSVDLNQFNGSMDELRSFTIQNNLEVLRTDTTKK